MTKHLTSAQRYHLFVEHQNRGTRKEKTQKEIAAEIGKHPSTVSREYKRNATARGGYNDTGAQLMAERRRSLGEPHNKTPRLLLWRIEQWITEEQWSPAQIDGILAKEGTHISEQTIYNHIHADRSGRLLANTRHKGKYNRKTKKGRKPTKATNIPNRTSIHDRPSEADGTRFGDWEMDLIIGKDGYGAILVLAERFGDSYCSWQKGLVEYTNKLIRRYTPKGADFLMVTPAFIKKIQAKLNRRPREKLNFSTPAIEFFKHFR